MCVCFSNMCACFAYYQLRLLCIVLHNHVTYKMRYFKLSLRQIFALKKRVVRGIYFVRALVFNKTVSVLYQQPILAA